MSIHPIAAAVSTLLGADRDGCDRAGVADQVALALQVRSWLDAVDAELAARASRLGESAAEVLTGGGRRRSREAEAVVARSSVLATMPALHDALAAGSVSAEHVDAAVRAADRLEPEERASLVELAPSRERLGGIRDLSGISAATRQRTHPVRSERKDSGAAAARAGDGRHGPQVAVLR